MSHSDSSTPISRHFVSFVPRYLGCAHDSLTAPVDTQKPRLEIAHRHPHTGYRRGNVLVSQGSWGVSDVRALLYDPGGPADGSPFAPPPMLPSGRPTPSASTNPFEFRGYHTAHTLAVYASQLGSLPDRARLATDLLVGLWPDGTFTR